MFAASAGIPPSQAVEEQLTLPPSRDEAIERLERSLPCVDHTNPQGPRAALLALEPPLQNALADSERVDARRRRLTPPRHCRLRLSQSPRARNLEHLRLLRDTSRHFRKAPGGRASTTGAVPCVQAWRSAPPTQKRHPPRPAAEQVGAPPARDHPLQLAALCVLLPRDARRRFERHKPRMERREPPRLDHPLDLGSAPS